MVIDLGTISVQMVVEAMEVYETSMPSEKDRT